LLLRTSVHGFVPSAHPTSVRTKGIYTYTTTFLSETPTPSDNNLAKSKLNKLNFLRLAKDNKEIRQVGESSKSKTPPPQYNVTSVEDLDTFCRHGTTISQRKGRNDYDSLLKALNVQGDTQNQPDNPTFTHPVAKLLHARRRNNSTPANRGENDKHRIALSIEGGGMRGCVSAGMICAVDYLNLTQSIDVVYGSSAGTVVGSYFITGQLRWFGPEVYYDRLTTAGRQFIDSRRLLCAG
jgi:hypothetical protein